MKYLNGEEILVIHHEIIDNTGGLHGINDVNLLGAVIEKPKTKIFGRESYNGVFEKAAVYLESLAKYHVFTDGNKRTAIAVATRFLFINGFELRASNREVETFALRVVNKNLGIRIIARWLEKNAGKRK